MIKIIDPRLCFFLNISNEPSKLTKQNFRGFFHLPLWFIRKRPRESSPDGICPSALSKQPFFFFLRLERSQKGEKQIAASESSCAGHCATV